MSGAVKAGEAPLVFVNRFYWPDMAATAQMLTDLAEDLARDGRDVTVITSRQSYTGAVVELSRQETRNGVKIVRVGKGGRSPRAMGPRIVASVRFLVGVITELTRHRRACVVPMTDPPFAVVAALLTRPITKSRVVQWVQDLYPDIAAELGAIPRTGLAFRAAATLGRWANRASDATIAIGPAMRAKLEGLGVPTGRVAVVHNWTDSTTIRPIAPEENPFIREQQLDGRFVVLYSGNAGKAHDFDGILSAMDILREHEGIVFMFIGGGPQMPVIRRRAEEAGLRNARFLDYVPREHLQFTLPAATVSLVSERPDVLGSIVPSKAYGILASGRPMVFLGIPESDVGRIVAEHDCGLIIDPKHGRALADALLDLKEHPEKVTALGARGRSAAESIYDRRIATRRWSSEVQRLLASSPGRP